MSFSFNFLPSEGNQVEPSHGDQSSEDEVKNVEASKPFVWLNDTFSDFLRLSSSTPTGHNLIALHDADDKSSVGRQYLAHVSERSRAVMYQKTDLVPREYEGGDVVWECSLDLCRYLYRNNIKVRGYVLELGCGHGLPGCWVLGDARREADACMTSVCFTDYNQFVLEATIENIVLNMPTEERVAAPSRLAEWLAEHTALGAGDWNQLSRILQLSASGANSNPLPPGLPSDGLFHCILASETTYSAEAAAETARFVINHLKDDGVAYIATKRYYFGVGGGSEAFREGMERYASGEGVFKIDTVEIHDNGKGNIREIVRVHRESV